MTIETYVLFSLIVLFIVLPILFLNEDRTEKTKNDFDHHVETAIDMRNSDLQ